jgi:carbon monoxide dehydrogenase subunit G
VSRTHAAVEIAQPPEVVFPWVVEPERRLQWVDGLEESAEVAAGRYRETFLQAGLRADVEVEVRTLDFPRAVEIHVTSKHFTADARTSLTATAAGTRVESTIEARYKGLMARAAAPVVTRQAQASLERSFENLKRLVESTP